MKNLIFPIKNNPGFRFPGAIFLLLLISFPIVTLAQVKTGAEQTELYYPLLKGKNTGIVANNASIVGKMNIVDVLVKNGFLVKRIFSPEHGFRMNAEAGEAVGNDLDSATGIQVVSLYGKHKKPLATDLVNIDVVLFDIQDVGVRFYTYISTLAYMMESCAENNIPLILLDRPNPNVFYIDGPILEKEYSSFVGMHPVPVVYGMTIGEYARMVNGEGWLKNSVRCNLLVIPLANYTHQTRYELPVRPSPNLPNTNAVYLYPSLCFFEGTVISVGRGTPYPFEVFGHPEMTTGSFTFTPSGIPGSSLHPPFEGLRCHGVDLREFSRNHPDGPNKISLEWLQEAYRDWHGKPGFFTGYFNKLAGNATLQQQIIQGKTEKEIRESWKPGIEKFKKIRGKYLLY
ncbi:MAG: DUF1343 domain-containing protein [Bacteroidota bacterium]